MRSKVICFAAILCLCAAAFFIYAPTVSDHPYAYDEADYMWAGKQGFRANYLDQNGLSFVAFVKKGLELSRDSSKRQSFSGYIRGTGDIGLYRHYHGPMYAYWLALFQSLGTVRETVFRGSGLLIHFASALIILFGFWKVFPSLPPPAGLAAAALFIFNRTALVAATTITQHVVFTFFSLATLFAASLFLKTLETRWFYATMALLACSFATVETSSLIVVALAFALMVEHRRLRERFQSLKKIAALMVKGVAVFVLTLLVCWPMGVLQLGIGKGFLTLAYMSVVRKNFNPFGPLDLWSAKFNSSPWEFSLLMTGIVAAFVLWRRSSEKPALLPWLSFIAVFFLVTLKVTLPYTYYYSPLTAAMTVTTGAAFGMLWNRFGQPALLLGATAIVVSIMGTTLPYRKEALADHDFRPYHFAVLKLVDSQPAGAGRPLYLPFQLVPTLHYYHPEIQTVGYDADFPVARLADGIRSPEADDKMLCEEEFCAAIERQSPGFALNKTLLDPVGPNRQPLYVIQVRKTGSL